MKAFSRGWKILYLYMYALVNNQEEVRVRDAKEPSQVSIKRESE